MVLLPLQLHPSHPLDKFSSTKFLRGSSQRGESIVVATKASLRGGKKLKLRKYLSIGGTKLVFVSAVAADPDTPFWFSNSTLEWLDSSLLGNFGFDPLGLGSDLETLRWNVQAELVHCKWAMLGAAEIFIPKLLTKIEILNTSSWYRLWENKNTSDPTIDNLLAHLADPGHTTIFVAFTP